jgi:NAD(P)H dehydrogenase (quinone)
MRIGVTGASGQLGRLVVQRLLESHPAPDIVAIVRDPAKAADLAAAGVDVRVADYDDRAALDAAVAGVDRLLLISGTALGRRVPQHSNVIDAAKAAGAQFLAYTSAPKATSTTLPVAGEHKATEEYLVSSGVPYAMLRNNWYTENYAPQVQSGLETGEFVAAAGEGRVASATRADFAAGAAAVLLGEGHENKVYELGGDHAWSYGELADTIAELSGKPCTYKAVKPAELVEILIKAGADEGTASFAASIDASIGEGALAETTGDLSRLIGRPTTPLKETVAKLLA